MIPASFEYVRPASLDEALSLLVGEGTKILAGGQSLLPLMKLRLARPERLVDIGALGALRGVRPLPDGRLAIGALTTYADLLADRQVTVYALLADALPSIGDVQVRNRGTIGGALAHCDPASDLPAVLLALGAEVVARSRRGERVIPVTGLFTGPFQTALAADEILTEVRLPAASGSYGSAYRSLDQPASGFAIAGAAVVIGRRDREVGPIEDARVAIAGVGEVPYRATAVERALLDGADDATAASHATDGITVNSDIHADAAYRTAIAAVIVRRAIEAAQARLG